MKTVIIGLGNQGKKRYKSIGKECIATVDPYNKKATYNSIKEVPINTYDSAIVSVQEDYKLEIINYLIKYKKNILVEKPLYFKDKIKLKKIFHKARENNIILYVAYNHRFENSINYISKLIHKNNLGKLYSCELTYGNGTSKIIKKNKWRDTDLGVISDLGSHLFDILSFWFGSNNIPKFEIKLLNSFENNAPDYVILAAKAHISIVLKLSFCYWKNKFTSNIYFEKGSIHSDSLEKWEDTKVILRNRILPSGKPKQRTRIFKKNDKTWIKEYKYFKKIVKDKISNDYEKNKWIQDNFLYLQKKLT